MPANSTVARSRRKAGDRPAKPYPDYPLYAHQSGHWARKINDRFVYFGRWGRMVKGKMVRLPDDGSAAAEALYNEQKVDLCAGREPRKLTGDELLLADLCNRFLTAKTRQLEAREIGQRMFDEYRDITDMVIAQFGGWRVVDDLLPEDFDQLRAVMAKRWGPTRLVNAITRTRSLFKFGFESGVMEKPMRFGPMFKPPSAAVLRKHRATGVRRMLSSEECRRLLDAAAGKEVPIGQDDETGEPITRKFANSPQLQAMLLLMFNAAYGNHDCATLPQSVVNLDGAIIEYPRPKSGIARRCTLWPETVEALRAAIAARPKPKSEDAEGLVFVTSRGRPWLSGGIANPVSHALRKLMIAAGVHQPGTGPYTLRHVFRTIADETLDTPATDLIMGHTDAGMGDRYREYIANKRLLRVTDHVRAWLLGEAAGQGGAV